MGKDETTIGRVFVPVLSYVILGIHKYVAIYVYICMFC